MIYTRGGMPVCTSMPKAGDGGGRTTRKNKRFSCTKCPHTTTKNQLKTNGGLCHQCKTPMRGFFIMDDWKDHPEMEEPSALVDFGFAPGGYLQTCPACSDRFIGAKRCHRCHDCALAKSKEPVVVLPPAIDTQAEMLSALKSLIHWKGVVELVAPELGGLLTAMYQAEAVVKKVEEE